MLLVALPMVCFLAAVLSGVCYFLAYLQYDYVYVKLLKGNPDKIGVFGVCVLMGTEIIGAAFWWAATFM